MTFENCDSVLNTYNDKQIRINNSNNNGNNRRKKKHLRKHTSNENKKDV